MYISQIIPNVVISPVQKFITGMYRDCEWLQSSRRNNLSSCSVLIMNSSELYSFRRFEPCVIFSDDNSYEYTGDSSECFHVMSTYCMNSSPASEDEGVTPGRFCMVVTQQLSAVIRMPHPAFGTGIISTSPTAMHLSFPLLYMAIVPNCIRRNIYTLYNYHLLIQWCAIKHGIRLYVIYIVQHSAFTRKCKRWAIVNL